MTSVASIRSIPSYRLTEKDVRFFLSIMLPALVELLLSQLFGMMDTIMLGHTENSSVLIAAVGMTASPINLIVCVISAFCIGTTAAVAWFTGAGESEKARCAAHQSLALLAVIGAVVTVLSLLFAEPIIRFAGAKEDTLADAVTYYRIIAAGFLVQSVTISITASLRGVGITKIPMLYNLTAALVNVILNYGMIYGRLGFPAMGIRGAAWATTISKFLAFVLAMLLMFFGKIPVGIRRGDSFRPNRQILTRILRVGITAGLEQVILQSGAVLNNKIVATVPTADFAANQIAANVEGLAWQLGNACNAASTTSTGQSLGEGRPEKARSMTRMILLVSLGFSACVILLFLFAGSPIAHLYTPEKEIAATAGRILCYTAIGMPGVATHLTIAGSLRGAGDTKTPLFASFCSLWIFRVGLGYLLVYRLGMGVIAARVCCSVDQLVRASIVSLRYLTGKWAKGSSPVLSQKCEPHPVK